MNARSSWPPVLLLGLAVAASAAPRSGPQGEQQTAGQAQEPYEYWITTSGGARGAYQAGVLYSLLRQQQSAREAEDAKRDSNASKQEPTAPVAQGKPEPPKRAPGPAGVSGVSAGAINALLVALQTCLPQRATLDPADNLLWSTWQAISWDALFPGDQTCEEYAQSHPELRVRCANPKAIIFGGHDGVLTRLGFEPVESRLRRVFGRSGVWHADEKLDESVEACSVGLALSFSAEDQANLPVGTRIAIPIPTSRRYTTARIQCMTTLSDGTELPCNKAVAKCPAGARCSNRIRVCDLPLRSGVKDGSSSDAPGVLRVQLPFEREQDARETSLPLGATGAFAIEKDQSPNPPACRPLALDPFMNMVLASAAAPLEFAPQEVMFCGHDCTPVDAPGLYCPAGTSLCQGRFFDGGLFDTQPVTASLALASSDCQTKKDEGCAQKAHHVIVSSLRADSSRKQVERLRGSTYYLRYFRDFVSVATDYELQILRRYKGREFPKIDPIPRSSPITSDLSLFDPNDTLGFHTDAFVGYLDPEFRLFDYYVGVASGTDWLLANHRLDEILASARETARATDQQPEQVVIDQKLGLGVYPGLATVAARVLAVPTPPPPAPPGGPGGQPALQGRSWQKLMELRQLLAQHLEKQACDQEAEYRKQLEAERGAAANQNDEPLELRELYAMDRIWTSLEKAEQVAAEHNDTDKYFLFAQNLTFTGPVFVRPGKGAAVAEWRFDPNNTRAHVSDLGPWRYNQLRQLFGRLEAIERADGSPATAAALVMGGYGAAIAGSSEHSGVSFGSSTVPDTVRSWAAAATLSRFLVPYTFRRDLFTGDLGLDWEWVSASTRFSYRLTPFGWGRLSIGPAVHRFGLAVPEERWHWGANLTAALDRPASPLLIPELGVKGALFVGPRPFEKPEPTIFAGLFVRPVWPLELGAGWILWDRPLGAPPWYVTLGLSDLSGLVFWLTRAAMGDGAPYAAADSGNPGQSH